MTRKSETFDPEVFTDMPAIKVLELDPSKPYFILLPHETPTEQAEMLATTL
jgi:hypothetical protein